MNHYLVVAVSLLVSTESLADPIDPVADPAEAADAGTGSSLADQIDAAAGQVPAATAPEQANPVLRAFQSLNPAISVITDLAAGIGGRTPYSLAGDDPDLMGGPGDRPAGVAVQELEFAFQAVVDPYLRADIFLTIPNLSGVEVEEAVATSTSLPWGFQVRAGIFRSAFGRQNTQHLHVQDFVKRPLINEGYLGADGLRAPGVQLSWLAPTPLFLQLSAEAFSVGPPEELEHLATFGGGRRTDLTWTGGLRTFIPATESLSISAGTNLGVGRTPGVPGEVRGVELVLHQGKTTVLNSVDLYLKFKPANQSGGYFSIAWTTELFFRQVLGTRLDERLAAVCADEEPASIEIADLLSGCRTEGLFDAGLYSQLVVQLARRWSVGLRQDLLGLVTSQAQPQVSRTSLAITFSPSEFAQLRAYVERETLPRSGQFFLEGLPNWAGYLQLQFAIGAHGGHSF